MALLTIQSSIIQRFSKSFEGIDFSPSAHKLNTIAELHNGCEAPAEAV